MLVQRLKAIQDVHGYLPEAELNALAAETKTPLYRIQEVASFFPHFRFSEPPRVQVHVCRDMACHLRGSRDLIRKLEEIPGCHAEGVSCLGRCDRAPAMVVTRHDDEPIHEHVFAGRTPMDMVKVVHDVIAGSNPAPDTDEKYVIDRGGWQIDPYKPGEEKYRAAKNFCDAYPDPVTLAEGAVPDEFVKNNYAMLQRLKDEDLRGMGGAGIPAYLKWFEVWKAKPVDGGTDKYIVCNADESEPATFKDRELLLRTPHLVVEGVILAGLVTNAKAGYIYIRHEYAEQIAACEEEIRRAERMGACGANVFGTGRSFKVEVFTSPGGYICGEESALIEAMEDRRAQPRNKPPEMMTNGYLDKPTVVNNVETLAWTPAIFLGEPKQYRGSGKRGANGRRFFSLCGDVAKPGVFEVPCGITLGELITLAGGMRDGLKLKAAALSGPSGGLLPAKFPLPKDYAKRIDKNLESLADDAAKAKFLKLMDEIVPDRKATHFDLNRLPLDKALLGQLRRYFDIEFILGAGLAVYAEGADVLTHALGYTEFFRNESCGKCVPCRIGSQKLVEIGTEVREGSIQRKMTKKNLELIRDDVETIHLTLNATSICGLGRAAGNALTRALRLFEDDIVT